MAKKNWIYIKRGLSEDPKHRAAMGECIWLYMHIIDRADWEMGIAYEWKDQQEANEMGMPVETLRYQRKKLEENDYIRCSKKQYSQDIRIMEWKNPRDYGSDTKNPRIQSDNLLQPSDFQSHNQSDNQSDNQLIAQIKTPTLFCNLSLGWDPFQYFDPGYLETADLDTSRTDRGTAGDWSQPNIHSFQMSQLTVGLQWDF